MRGLIFVDRHFAPGEVKYDNGIISEVNLLDEASLSAAERENYIIPGLVDIHLHGCMGVDFCDLAGKNSDALNKMTEYEKSVGVTSICPTTMTLDEDSLSKIMNAARLFNENANRGSVMVGVHLEGPFISHDKCGAQNPEFIKSPDVELVKTLNEESGDLVRLVTVAPEIDGAIEFIQEISRENKAEKGRIQVSIAHTTADYDTASAAIKAGANHVTHLYNAMPAFLNRAPGVVGAAFDDKSTYVEMICDGIHIHPSTVRATFEMFGADRIVLISDSMEATGMPDGKYALGGQDVYKQGHLATLIDGTIAGSATNLFDCMKKAVEMGIPMEDAVLAATVNPAKSIGLDSIIGSIKPGMQAKLLVCDKDLNLKEVIS